MTLIACGINHKTAPIALREKFALHANVLTDTLQNINTISQESVILSTCNRTEYYCELEHIDHMFEWIEQTSELKAFTDIRQHFYVHTDKAAINHMLRVACGLDSMILGESQILGQLKNAFSLASETGTIGELFSKLFPKVFSIAKLIRHETAIGENPISLAYIAANLARQIFTDITTKTVLIIGAGENCELIAQYLHEQGVKQLLIANRTLEKARTIVTKFSGKCLTIGEIPEYLDQADIIISSTASPLPILGKGAIETALKKRKRKPMLMIDLAVPRDIEPEVAELEDVYLYCVDDLQNRINNNLKEREAAAAEAEIMLKEQAELLLSWLDALPSLQLIRQYRDQSEHWRDLEVAKALKQLHQGVPAELLLKELGRTLTNKIMHVPSVKLREACYDSREDVIQSAKFLFDLEKE